VWTHAVDQDTAFDDILLWVLWRLARDPDGNFSQRAGKPVTEDVKTRMVLHYSVGP
jgi:hypothetical protein